MSCSIQRNQEGKITKVLTPQGQESELFKNIHSNLFLTDSESSLELTYNGYAPAIVGRFTGATDNVYANGEPMLFYKTSTNQEFDNLEEVLLAEEVGVTQMGFKDPITNEFLPIAKFSPRGSKNAEFLTENVREGVISAERVLGEDGVTYYQGKGNYPETRRVTAEMMRLNIRTSLGGGKVKVRRDGTFTMDFNTDMVLAKRSDGTSKAVRLSDVPSLIEEGGYENIGDLIAQYSMIEAYSAPKVEEAKPKSKVNTKVLESSLYNFLKGMGFSVTSLESYRKNYNTKYGKDPDIQALADMANKIVAFKEGAISIEDLSEEVAHIAIEFYADKNSMVEALNSVHLTQEYAESAEYYRTKYSKDYEGVALEEQVRREILGKVLAKEFLNRFSTENKTEEQLEVQSLLKRIWDRFTSFLQGGVKGYHVKALDTLNKRIADSVLSNNMEDFNLEEISENYYYSALPQEFKQTEADLRKTKLLIEAGFKKALRGGVIDTTQLEVIRESMDENDLLSSVNAIVGVTAHQVTILEAGIAEAERTGGTLSSIDENRAVILNDVLNEVVSKLKNDLDKHADKFSTDKNKELARTLGGVTITNLRDRIASAKVKLSTGQLSKVRKMVSEALDAAGVPVEMREKVMKQTEVMEKDRTILAKMFGLQSLSANPLMSIMSAKVVAMRVRINNRFLGSTNKLLKGVDEKGLEKLQKDTIKRDEKGDQTHHMKSYVNQHGFEQAKQKAIANYIAKKLNKDSKEILKSLKRHSPLKLLKANITDSAEYLEAAKELRRAIGEWEMDNVERFFTKEYYVESERIKSLADISDHTRATLDKYRGANFERNKKFQKADGTIDRSDQTELERIEDEDAKKAYRSMRSAYDSFGNLYEGLRLVSVENLTSADKLAIEKQFGVQLSDDFKGDLTLLEEGFDKSNLSNEARVALDLFNLSLVYRGVGQKTGSVKSNKAVDSFADSIEEFEDSGKSGFDWAMANSTFEVSSEFYDELGVVKSFADKAQDYVSQIVDPNEQAIIQAQLDEYKSLQVNKRELLKQHRKPRNPIETDVKNMSEPHRAKVRELDGALAKLRSDMKLPSELFEKSGEEVSTMGLTEDFEKLWKESNLTEFEFALKHMTPDNHLNTLNFVKEFQNLLEGKQTKVRGSFERVISKLVEEGAFDGKSQSEMLDIAKTAFAKTRVASYFQKFSPKGFSEAMEAMKSGELKVSEVARNKEQFYGAYPGLRYLDIRPDYTWTEEVNNEKYMNKYYKKEGGPTQPKLLDDKGKPLWLDTEYFKEFGISQEKFLAHRRGEEVSEQELLPTKNKDLHDFIEMLAELNDETLEDYGMKGSVSRYQRPGMSKTVFEKGVGILNPSNAKDIKGKFQEFLENRVDDKLYGEIIEDEEGIESEVGSLLRIIPKYFINQLDPATLTENVLEAALMHRKHSIEYSERTAAESELRDLEFAISQQKFVNKGRLGSVVSKGSVSQYLESATEFINHHLYGVKQTRHFEREILGVRVDLSKMVNVLQGFQRFTNLAFNPFVDLTSGTTGIINNLSDRFSGQYYHSSSSNRAKGVLPKLVGSYLSESGKIRKTSELNHILEFMQVQDADSRLSNSKFGRFGRLVQKSAYAGSKAMNLPVTPDALLSIMFDHRLYEGRFVNFKNFTVLHRQQNKDITKGELSALWEKLKTESMYDYMKVTEDGVTYSDKLKEKFEDPETVFKELQTRVVGISKQVIQAADGVINEVDQTAAQRDFFMSSMMMHSGWLPIGLTKRWRGEHFNFTTMEYEEGHYMSLMKVFGGIIKGARSPQAIKEMLEEMTPNQRENIKRSIVDMGMLGALFALVSFIMAGDDDDDTMVEDLTQLIALRTYSEFNTSQLTGTYGSLVDKAKSPIVSIRTVEALNPTNLLGNTTGFFLGGKEGRAEALEGVVKHTPLKRIGQLSDLQNTIDTFKHFNKESLGALADKRED